MTAYNILEARNNLSRIVASVESGAQEAVIMRRGKPVAKIVAVVPGDGTPEGNRLAEFFATYRPPTGGQISEEIAAETRELPEAGV